MARSTLASAVKRLRSRRGWTQAQLAQRAGLTQGYIAKLENPRYNVGPAIDVVLRLAKAFGVGVAALVTSSKPGRTR
jgi:transcriptional regulator with XRE-family HTH domain